MKKTKWQLKKEFFEMVDRDLIDRLFNLYENGRITYGCYLVYSIYDNYNYRVLLEKPLNKITKMEMLICIEVLKKDIERARKFVEEQENLPFEETQKQQLLKEVNA